MDVLKAIRHADKVPKLLREIEENKNTITSWLACAADEIEKLRAENKQLKKELRKK